MKTRNAHAWNALKAECAGKDRDMLRLRGISDTYARRWWKIGTKSVVEAEESDQRVREKGVEIWYWLEGMNLWSVNDSCFSANGLCNSTIVPAFINNRMPRALEGHFLLSNACLRRNTQSARSMLEFQSPNCRGIRHCLYENVCSLTSQPKHLRVLQVPWMALRFFSALRRSRNK